MAQKIKFGSPAWRRKYKLGSKKGSKTIKSKSRGKSMAKRRKTRRKSPGFRAKTRRAHKSAKSGLVYDIVVGAGYGALRQQLSKLVEPLAVRLVGPFGNYADNAAVGLATWAVAKGMIPIVNKFPMSRKIGRVGLIVEAAMTGAEVREKGFSANGGNGNDNNLFSGQPNY